MRILVAGGGTAGHVFPGLALGRVLARRGHEVSFMGTKEGPEARLVPAAGFHLQEVRALPFVRRVSLSALRAPFAALASVRRSRSHVAGADVVVGMGGYVSVSAVMAGWRERVPTVLHEQNAVPGLANRALSRVARAVALSFAEAARFFPGRTEVTGNPVREQILKVGEERDMLAKEAIRELELDEQRRTVVVFGGSQGALRIDRAAVGACRLLRDRTDLQILLITGSAHLEQVRAGLPKDGGGLLVRAAGFLERMELAYAVADLVVSRAGASSIAEISACGLPALLIPYPHATNRHQEANARALQRAGGSERSDGR